MIWLYIWIGSGIFVACYGAWGVAQTTGRIVVTDLIPFTIFLLFGPIVLLVLGIFYLQEEGGDIVLWEKKK